MGPGVGGDLMALGDHALDQGRVRGSGVNRAFAKVVAGHEECGMEAELLQKVQQLGGI